MKLAGLRGAVLRNLKQHDRAAAIKAELVGHFQSRNIDGSRNAFIHRSAPFFFLVQGWEKFVCAVKYMELGFFLWIRCSYFFGM